LSRRSERLFFAVVPIVVRHGGFRCAAPAIGWDAPFVVLASYRGQAFISRGG
jgi:hypothetical protein